MRHISPCVPWSLGSPCSHFDLYGARCCHDSREFLLLMSRVRGLLLPSAEVLLYSCTWFDSALSLAFCISPCAVIINSRAREKTLHSWVLCQQEQTQCEMFHCSKSKWVDMWDCFHLSELWKDMFAVFMYQLWMDINCYGIWHQAWLSSCHDDVRTHVLTSVDTCSDICCR